MNTTTKALTITIIAWIVIVGAATLYTGMKAMKSLRQIPTIETILETGKK